MVRTSTPNKSAMRFCDIQNVSLLKTTSIRTSPCPVLYNKILADRLLLIDSGVDISCLKYSLAICTCGFFPSAFSAIIKQAIRDKWIFSTLRKEPEPTLTISTVWLKCSDTLNPLLLAIAMALFIIRVNF